MVSAADGYRTLFELLGGEYLSKKIRKLYDTGRLFSSLVMVWLGIKRETPEIPGALTFPLGQPWQVDPETTISHLYLRKMDSDPAIAPLGKTVLSTMIPTRNFSYWQGLRDSDREQYGYEKQRILHHFIETLEEKFGNIQGHIEETELPEV